MTTQQLKNAIINSADNIVIEVPGNGGTNITQNVKRLNAYKAVKYVFSNYSITYSLNDYSNNINYNKNIVSNSLNFLELNSFMKINVAYSKKYEFKISGESAIDVYLYDNNLNELAYSNMSNSSNIKHFIKYLDIGTYYLRAKYTNISQTGIINTKINTRNSQYLSIDENDILINAYNGISD